MIKKTLLAAMAALAIGCVATGSASAQDALARAKQTGKVTVGIFNQAPWGYVDADGKIKGQATDVLKAAFEPLGIKEVEAVVTEFGALIPGLQSRRFDVIAAGLFINADRCKLVAFGDPDIKMSDGLLVLKGNPKGISSYTDIAKGDAVLAVARGSAQAKNAAAAGVPEARLALYPDNQSALSAMLSGRADAVTATAASVIALAASASDKAERALPFTGAVGADGKPVYGYPALAFRQADTDFRDAYNAELAKLKSDGKLLSILETYGFSSSEMPPEGLTSADLCK